MTGWRVGLLLGLGLVVVVAVTFVLGMRAKWPPVRDAVRRLNRRFLNPIQLRTAGRRGAYAGIVRHRGRVSGTAYETPVGVVPSVDGFAIVLPYGPKVDWLENIVAAGVAELVTEGATHTVVDPRVVHRSTVPELIDDEFSLRLLAVDDVVLLTRA